MPINIDSYSTTAGSVTDRGHLSAAIKEAIVTDDLDTRLESKLHVQNYGTFHPLFITGTYPSEAKIPPFAHPISILNIRGKNFICSDLRIFLKKDIMGDFTKRISNRLDFDYAVSRTILNLFWAGGRSSEFRSGFGFSAKVFGEWISQVLVGSLGLEMQESIPIQIVSLAYYFSLCEDTAAKGLEDKQKLIDWIYHLTSFDEGGISKIIGILKPMDDLKHFIENLKLVIENIRLHKLNDGTFTSLIRSNWYGVNAQQVLGVCTEHPPTWTALIFHCLSSKGYQKSLIGQVTLKAGKRGEADSFLRHYDEMFKQQMRLEDHVIINDELDNHRNYDSVKLSMEAFNRIPHLS